MSNGKAAGARRKTLIKNDKEEQGDSNQTVEEEEEEESLQPGSTLDVIQQCQRHTRIIMAISNDGALGRWAGCRRN